MHHVSIRSLLAGALVSAVVVGCATDTANSAAPSPNRSVEPSVSAATSMAPSSPATAAASPTQEPGEGGALAISWTEQSIDGWIHDIATDGDRIVAVGRTGDVFTAWFSTDGTAWESVTVPPPGNFMGDSEGLPEDLEARGSQMGTLVRLDETLYSFGLFNFMDFVRPVGWRWTDGQPWSFIDSKSDFYASGRVADAVAADGGLVAARLEVALSWAGADSTIWRWTPEASWVQADLSHTDSERTYVTRLAHNDGLLVASGLLPLGDADDPDAAAVATWESSNGEAWSAIDPPAGATQICALEAHPSGGFLAIGTGANGVTAWRKSDGLWSERVLTEAVDTPQGFGGPLWDVCWAFPLDDGLVALYPSDDGLRAWTSSDGDDWTDGGVVAPQAHLAAAADDLLVLVRPVEPADPVGGSILRIVRIQREIAP